MTLRSGAIPAYCAMKIKMSAGPSCKAPLQRWKVLLQRKQSKHTESSADFGAFWVIEPLFCTLAFARKMCTVYAFCNAGRDLRGAPGKLCALLKRRLVDIRSAMKFGIRFRLIALALVMALMGLLILFATLNSQNQVVELGVRLRQVDSESFQIADQFRRLASPVEQAHILALRDGSRPRRLEGICRRQS